MKVRFSLDAQAHIAAIHSYINERNPIAASRVVIRIRAATARLGEFPRLGHEGLTPGTREWVVTGLPYVIVHKVRPEIDEVIILGIYHGAQNRDPEHEP
jgi:plasmid stabilization system protein ParE